MYENRRWFILIILIPLFVMINNTVWAGEHIDLSNRTLEGLRSIYVQVEVINFGTKDEKLLTRQLLKDTEQQLRSAGIDVLTKEKYERLKVSRHYPLARLEVLTKIIERKEPKNIIVYNILRVRQSVFLARKPAIQTWAATWTRQIMSFESDMISVQEVIKVMVGEFIMSFQSVNSE